MKTPVQLLGASAVAITLAMTAPAMADFNTWDTNADSSIDSTEFNTGFESHETFNRWDADQDGALTGDEWDAGIHTRRDNQPEGEDWNPDYNTWDSNADQSMDSNEFNTGVFNSYDANGDGMLDSEEYSRYQEEEEQGFWDF